jgi:hypothetical protein
MKVNISPSAVTSLANHSASPSGVLSREKSTFGEQFRVYSVSIFCLIPILPDSFLQFRKNIETSKKSYCLLASNYLYLHPQNHGPP